MFGAEARSEAPRIFDMHCHPDFAADLADAVRDVAHHPEIGFFANTVEPAAYPVVRRAFASCPNAGVGLGWHPWWIPADAEAFEAGRALFERLAAQHSVRLFGEVGLDYAPAHAETAEHQRVAFAQVLETVAARPGSVVSIHCVRAYDDALDLVERSGAASAGACIFHWFSGSSDQLQRAVRLGCLFSVGERMLATKRGRAYAKAVPADRLLLETDLPSAAGEPFSSGLLAESLERALDALEELRGQRLSDAITLTSSRLMR